MQYQTPHGVPQTQHGFDLSKVDLRRLSPEQWVELKKQIALRARSDRNRAIGIAIGGTLGWAWRVLRYLMSWRQLRAAWISHGRRRGERIAAAELRGLSDQWLADMGLTRGQIENRVRYRARALSRAR